MKRQLVLMRHGKSDWSEDVSDYMRSIKPRGFHESERIGDWMTTQGVVPEYIISSPAVRARQTAETTINSLGLDPDAIHWNDSVYMADISELLDAIAQTPDECQSLMVVGHNPGLEDLMFYLTEHIDVPVDGKVLPTATIAILETESDWADLEHASCTLELIVRGRYL